MKKIIALLFALTIGFSLTGNSTGNVEAAGQNCLSCPGPSKGFPSGTEYKKTASGQWACCSKHLEVGCGATIKGTAQCRGNEGCDQDTGKCTAGVVGGPIYNKVDVYFKEIQEQAMPTFKFKDAKIGQIVSDLLPYLFGIAGLLLLLYLIYGGFELMTSGGDPKKMDQAKGKITNALVGFIIIFVSFWLIKILEIVLGLPLIF